MKSVTKGSTDSLHGTYSGYSTDFDVTTGFSDLVSYQSETLTIYVYPVIGQKVCPSGNPDCADSEKVPLTINVAGPDTITYKQAFPGNKLTWYQPPWIPGNILSYPGSFDQLKAAAFQNASDFQELTSLRRGLSGLAARPAPRSPGPAAAVVAPRAV